MLTEIGGELYRVRAQIREAATGETVVHTETFEAIGDAYSSTLFQWLEGNYGCDCNRELFFRRIQLADPDWWGDVTCSDGERFILEWLELNGVRIWEATP